MNLNPRQLNRIPSRTLFWMVFTLTVSIISLAIWLPQNVSIALAQQDESEGYYYTVQVGDSWATVSTRTGLSQKELQAANPQAIRLNLWLRTGEKLFIPAPEPETTDDEQYHIIEPGESWSTIARDYGISIRLLQAVNPRSIRSGLVLYRGERLFIPPEARIPDSPDEEEQTGDTDVAGDDETPTPTTTPDAGSDEKADTETNEGEDASATATAVYSATTTALDIPTLELDSVATPTATPTNAVTIEADEEADATETAQAFQEEPEGKTPETTEREVGEPDATNTAESEQYPDGTPKPEPTANNSGSEDENTDEGAVPEGCLENFADYPDILLALLNAPGGGVEIFYRLLEDCKALIGVETNEWTGDNYDDLVVIYKNPDEESAFEENELIIFNGADGEFELGYRARAAGQVNLLATIDINGDGQSDITWLDTTCGASTCFDTVSVRSWDGTAWRDWTEGTITMAYSEVTLEDRMNDDGKFEIVLNGGLYGSVGAGPQRERVEVWGSIDGAPYTLIERTFNASECIYFAVLDGNNAFLQGDEASLEQAKEFYLMAAEDEQLKTCWLRDNEMVELRSFSLFRLALVEGYQGNADGAVAMISRLRETYPDEIYAEIGQVWLDEYQSTNDVSQACVATNQFAERNPESWQILAEYGVTNPSFEAADTCPILDISVPSAQFSPAVESSTDDETSSDEASEQATENEDSENENRGTAPDPEPTPAGTEETDTDSETTENGDEGNRADSEDGSDEETEEAEAALAPCPDNLTEYGAAAEDVLNSVEDIMMVREWMTTCNVLADDRGAAIFLDLNGDDVEDALLLPTVISDIGFGSDGAQGLVLIYHNIEGVYNLVATPDTYGEPKYLTVDDLNEDGLIDLVWTVTGCSTFCITEVQLVSWNSEAYVINIAPGATIAEGAPSFRDVSDESDPGQGQELVLIGGVSGTPEGGLSVPHEEIWQSVDGNLYQRIRWTYDREAEGNDCLGLRLIEADIALQASGILGYDTAIDLYINSFDPSLRACSLFGTAETEELILLQGLASFRLIQAQALSGDLDAANVSLDALLSGQPDSDYANISQDWLAFYSETGDAFSACEAVASVFEENKELWQIMDQYGLNHPTLAAEQICYVP